MLSLSTFETFGSDGFVVTPPVFSAPEIGEVRAECERLLSGSTRWALLGVASRSPGLMAFAKHAVFQKICALTIGRDVDLFFDGVLLKPSLGGKELRWHQDAAYGRTDPPYISCWVPLRAGSAESGGLCVAPGSHRSGPVEHARGEETSQAYAGRVASVIPRASLPLDLSPGQVAVLHSELLHRTGPNSTATGRLACQFGFVAASTRFLDPGLSGDHKVPLFRSLPNGSA